MIQDKEFLKQLFSQRNQNRFAKITALDLNEYPLEEIQGRITQGSLSLDGASALRRTCSLTLVANNYNYNDFYWGVKTKIKIEIGLSNSFNPDYPNIIWFEQGIFILTSFNVSRAINNFTISLSGKDKMCLLDGSIGGSITAQTDFGKIEEENDKGEWIIRPLPIKDIIRNIVHVYANEPYHNIIINDLDTYGLELLEYRYDTPMYLYRDEKSNIYNNILFETQSLDGTLSFDREGKKEIKQLSEIPETHLESLTNFTEIIDQANPIYYKEIPYIFTKIQFGDTAGYKLTELIYAGELVANVGESVTSVLDKIKNMLVEYEYFYDIHGRFVFQKKPSYLKLPWDYNNMHEKIIQEGMAVYSDYSYEFYGSELLTAMTNTPNLSDIKNDFSIWSERTSLSETTIPIHLRYAIDTIPTGYTSITVSENDVKEYNEQYNTTLSAQKSQQYTDNWREIIYQMAIDYYKYNWLDDFELRLASANPTLYPLGKTGYEQYYTDMQGFWRELYNPELENQILRQGEEWAKAKIKSEEVGAEPSIELLEAEKTLDNLIAKQDNYYLSKIYTEYALATSGSSLCEFKYKEITIENSKKFYNKNIFEAPYRLNFWIDFLNSEDGNIAKYNIKVIGDRPKSINDNKIKSIYFRETPNVIWIEDSTQIQDDITAYRYLQVPNYYTMFSISAQGKSAWNELETLLNKHACCNESANITSLPIFCLEPNSRIYLYDNDTGVQGDYLVSKISLPLTYNGTMTLTTSKILQEITL